MSFTPEQRYAYIRTVVKTATDRTRVRLGNTVAWKLQKGRISQELHDFILGELEAYKHE